MASVPLIICRIRLYCTAGLLDNWRLVKAGLGQHALITRVCCTWPSSAASTHCSLFGCFTASTHWPVTSSLGPALGGQAHCSCSANFKSRCLSELRSDSLASTNINITAMVRRLRPCGSNE